MGVAREARLWLVQRVTAIIMTPLILAHLFTMIYAVQNGLSAAEILERTRGSVGWLVFYGLFVLCAAAHGSIGLRTVAIEWFHWRGKRPELFALLTFVFLVILGVRAVVALVGGA
ncbi:MAG: succinate dehydrogenase [Alphaproteobacteria bacterium]